jgi:hypothetical protein
MNSGPAITPQASSAFVTFVVASDGMLWLATLSPAI